MGKIFYPYYTNKKTGTGIGLLIILGFVEKHGGSIVVDSEQNKGACFEICLPISKGGYGKYTRQYQRFGNEQFKLKPSLLMNGRNINIIDLSEGGVNVFDDAPINYGISQEVSGDILFSNNDNFKVECVVFRKDNYSVAIHLKKGIPTAILVKYVT